MTNGVLVVSLLSLAAGGLVLWALEMWRRP